MEEPGGSHRLRIAHLGDTTVSPKWAVEEVIEEDHSKMGWPLLGEALLATKGSGRGLRTTWLAKRGQNLRKPLKESSLQPSGHRR